MAHEHRPEPAISHATENAQESEWCALGSLSPSLVRHARLEDPRLFPFLHVLDFGNIRHSLLCPRSQAEELHKTTVVGDCRTT